jgi:hypothetical protein
MKNYYNINTFERKNIDETLYNHWVTNNNPKCSEWLETPSQPSYDPQNETVEWINGSWVILPIEKPSYSADEWLTNQGFNPVILITLLDLENKLKEQNKTSSKLTSVRSWINGVLSEYITNSEPQSEWLNCPFNPQETVAEAFAVLNN